MSTRRNPQREIERAAHDYEPATIAVVSANAPGELPEFRPDVAAARWNIRPVAVRSAKPRDFRAYQDFFEDDGRERYYGPKSLR